MFTIDDAKRIMRMPNDWPVASGHEEVEVRNLQWARDTTLVRNPRDADSLRSWQIAACVARVYHRARGAGLLFGTHWVTWALVFDDMFDNGIDTTPQAAAALDNAHAILFADTRKPAPVTPLGPSIALWDLMTRAEAVMSPEWMARMRGSVHNYFSGLSAGYLAFDHEEQPTWDTLYEARQRDIGMILFCDLIELYEGFEMPLVLANSATNDRMRNLLSSAIVFQNDLLSYRRDLANLASGGGRGRFNLVFALQRDKHIDVDAAAKILLDMYFTKVDELHATRDKLLWEARDLGYTGDDLERITLFCEDFVDLVPGTFYGHILTANRGYFDSGSRLTAGNDLIADYTGHTLRPLRRHTLPAWR